MKNCLDRAQKAHKQNQQKSREIYDMMKKKLMDKNTVITGLTDQVTQLKVMLDNAADIFSGKDAPADPDNDRTAAYLVDTDSSVDDIRPALAETEALETGEKIVDMTTNMTQEAETVTKSTTVTMKDKNFKVVDIAEIKSNLTPIMAAYIQVIGDTGLTEYSEIRNDSEIARIRNQVIPQFTIPITAFCHRALSLLTRSAREAVGFWECSSVRLERSFIWRLMGVSPLNPK